MMQHTAPTPKIKKKMEKLIVSLEVDVKGMNIHLKVGDV